MCLRLGRYINLIFCVLGSNILHMLLSIIIPTRNSETVLPMCLKAIDKQTAAHGDYEVIVVDNESTDATHTIALQHHARFFSVKGKPSKACEQRNTGAHYAKGEYLFFLDHDMELHRKLIETFLKQIHNNTDAWYIPENIKASSALFEKLRNYERSFYTGTPVDAARILRKKMFAKTKGYDPALSSGPADWDMDIQLKLAGAKFDIVHSTIIHHEENLGITAYFSKKAFYTDGIEKYQQKWKRLHQAMYKHVVARQLGMPYRFFTVFVERGKYKEVLKHPLLFLALIVMKLYIGINFVLSKHG